MTAPVEARPGSAPAEPGRPATASSRRPLLAWVSVLAVTFSGIVGSNLFGIRDFFWAPATPDAVPPVAGRAVDATPASPAVTAPTQLRSQPWWQDVTTLEGTGTTSASAFTIVPGAVQWRVKGTCGSGRLVVRAPGQRQPVVDAACTGELTGYGTGSGPVSLDVTATGSWKLAVAQQIDAPLVEPPLAAMTGPGAAAVSSGSFYDIDKTAVGEVTLFRQADGRYSLRLEDFFVTPNADLELRLSTLEAPKTSQEYIDNGSSELVVVMDVTAGSLNYPVPAGIDPTKFKSVVIWCAPVSSAYGAATLGGVR